MLREHVAARMLRKNQGMHPNPVTSPDGVRRSRGPPLELKEKTYLRPSVVRKRGCPYPLWPKLFSFLLALRLFYFLLGSFRSVRGGLEASPLQKNIYIHLVDSSARAVESNIENAAVY